MLPRKNKLERRYGLGHLHFITCGRVAHDSFGLSVNISSRMIPSRYVPSEVVTGMDQQIVSGIYDFPAREYNGDEGRWPSPDPAGLASVNPADPQTWNRYAYVRKSPLFMTDPTGMGDDWGGANGEDPYCLEDFCANGMPDYYGNDYNANDWVQAPDSGFGCMWNGSINTLRCPTNDCIPSTDAFGCASFYGPQSVSPSPTWAFVSTFFGNLASWDNFWKPELSSGGCLNAFVNGANEADAHMLGKLIPPGGPPLVETGIKALYAQRAFDYAASYGGRGLVNPLGSKVVGRLAAAGESTAAAVTVGYFDAQAVWGVHKEWQAAKSGACH